MHFDKTCFEIYFDGLSTAKRNPKSLLGSTKVAYSDYVAKHAEVRCHSERVSPDGCPVVCWRMSPKSEVFNACCISHRKLLSALQMCRWTCDVFSFPVCTRWISLDPSGGLFEASVRGPFNEVQTRTNRPSILLLSLHPPCELLVGELTLNKTSKTLNTRTSITSCDNDCLSSEVRLQLRRHTHRQTERESVFAQREKIH